MAADKILRSAAGGDELIGRLRGHYILRHGANERLMKLPLKTQDAAQRNDPALRADFYHKIPARLIRSHRFFERGGQPVFNIGL